MGTPYEQNESKTICERRYKRRRTGRDGNREYRRSPIGVRKIRLVSEFNQLAKNPARVKQVFDITRVGEGSSLNNIKNSLNGLHFGFGIPNEQIKIVAARRSPRLALWLACSTKVTSGGRGSRNGQDRRNGRVRILTALCVGLAGCVESPQESGI
jgi:hypothetical protein